jgi:ribonuclease HI
LKKDPSEPIVIYTDGSCLGNPGPAGCGIVLIYGKRRKEVSEYLGEATNNIAELTAILKALQLVKKKNLPIHLYSDSEYAIGVLSSGWKARANRELIQEIIEKMKEFPSLKLLKVDAHVGIRENERVDKLAKEAILHGTRIVK